MGGEITATPRLEQVIAGILADAKAFHGDLGLAVDAWRARLVTILQKCGRRMEAAAIPFVEQLHGRDLYLTTACAHSHDSAWRRFEALYQRQIHELVRCLSRNPLQAIDVGETLLVDLFLPDRTGHSRIGSYDGRSSLATWLHVIVTHRVANERVRKWNTVERPGEMPELPDSTLVRELEAGMRAHRYGSVFESALRAVCQRLSARECQMLVWRYQNHLLLEEIASRLAIHTSTACRQLDRLHLRIRKEVITILSKTYGLNDDAIDECLSDAIENCAGAVSLLGLIRAASPAARAHEKDSGALRIA
jgi:RNA polymerase sigma factor (sigma-70 family)